MIEATAGLFPGQGISADEVLAGLPAGHSILRVADEIVGYDIRRKVETASRAKRKNQPLPTALAQVSIFTAGIVAWSDAGEEERDLQALAGHSLGEYTALVAAGSVTFEAGLTVVHARGRAMQIAARGVDGGMAALIGFSLAEAENLAAASGTVVANDNAPGQVVISGARDALSDAAAMASARGGRCILLQVDGPFHSPQMEAARWALESALDRVEIRSPAIPVISNVTAQPYRSPGEIRKLLVEQLTGRVLFRSSCAYLAERGIGACIDFGPGAVVGKLFTRTVRTKEVTGAGAR